MRGRAAAGSYVYAIGRIEARFPNLWAEKEFAESAGRTDTAGRPIGRPSTPFYGLMVPIVGLDQIYSFDRDALIKAIPRPNEVAPEQFGPAAEEVFDRTMQLIDNAGATDEHRAPNYLAMRYPAIYAKAAEAFVRDSSMTGVEVRSSPMSSTRNVVDVIFSYTNRTPDSTEESFVRVDVTEEFPFL